MEGLILRERMEESGCMYISARKEGGVEQVSRWFRGEVGVLQTPSSQKWVRPDQPLPPRGILSPC